jgi:hypothetical protein
MRDKLKNPQYWEEGISLTQKLRCQTIYKLKNGMIADDRINDVKQYLVDTYLRTIKSKYSAGYPSQELKNDLLEAIDLTYESWNNDSGVKFNYEGRYLNQFLKYDEMLWMLSLGYLLDVDNEDFKKLVNVIDRHHIQDFLFEFIIRAKLKDRKSITEESYEHGWILFGKLRQAITETDKVTAEKLVKDFVRKDWYKEHKNTGWYNSHKNLHHDVYFGYWSFETAAVVKIMGLDDSSFRDCQYYPKDLILDFDMQ